MVLKNGAFADDLDNHSGQENNGTPEAFRVDDADNLSEDDLERALFTNGNDKNKPVMEGQGMGGQNFGQNNLTPSGNDKNNLSQNAGDTNAYFDRTEPSEEHPEDSNFKPKDQGGVPDSNEGRSDPSINIEAPKAETRNGESDHPHPQEDYQEGTADNEEVNIPGPNELPDQQKVGEGNGN